MMHCAAVVWASSAALKFWAPRLLCLRGHSRKRPKRLHVADPPTKGRAELDHAHEALQRSAMLGTPPTPRRDHAGMHHCCAGLAVRLPERSSATAGGELTNRGGAGSRVPDRPTTWSALSRDRLFWVPLGQSGDFRKSWLSTLWIQLFLVRAPLTRISISPHFCICAVTGKHRFASRLSSPPAHPPPPLLDLVCRSHGTPPRQEAAPVAAAAVCGALLLAAAAVGSRAGCGRVRRRRSAQVRILSDGCQCLLVILTRLTICW